MQDADSLGQAAYKPFSNDDAMAAALAAQNAANAAKKPGQTAVGGEGNPPAADGSGAAGGAAADLTTALTQLKNIVKKYNVTMESRNNLKRRLISEHLHEFSPAEQIRIFTILIENKPEQLNEFIAPLVKGLGRMFGVGKGAKAGVRKAVKAKADSQARRSLVNKARNPIRAALPKVAGAGLTGWGAYEGAKELWDWWKEPPEENPEDQPVGEPGGVPGGGPEGGAGGGEGEAGQGGTVGQAVAAGFISKEDVDIIKKQLPILVRYFGLDTTDADLKLDIKATIDGIEDLREKAMAGQLPALAVAATDKPWGKSGDSEQDIGPLPKRATVDGKTYERPTGWPDKWWRAYLTAMKKLGFLMKDEQ